MECEGSYYLADLAELIAQLLKYKVAYRDHSAVLHLIVVYLIGLTNA